MTYPATVVTTGCIMTRPANDSFNSNTPWWQQLSSQHALQQRWQQVFSQHNLVTMALTTICSGDGSLNHSIPCWSLSIRPGSPRHILQQWWQLVLSQHNLPMTALTATHHHDMICNSGDNWLYHNADWWQWLYQHHTLVMAAIAINDSINQNMPWWWQLS